MFSLSVRGHMMIAHSFRGQLFGPAQRLHGATYVVDLELRARMLGPSGVIADIGRAEAALRAVLGELDYRNLDDVPELAGENTTTEFLAKLIFDRMAARAARGELGSEAPLAAMKVTLHESHLAWAAYEADVK